ncbi:MAG: primosomal protein N' [Clostridia bacterium]|nr:primosomal protein N' [Clostridia bacterium]
MIDSGGAGCALLHGVTGSGKTAVYVELIRKVVSQGKTAIMLVPEIALTPQMVRGFRRHFGSRVAVMHSTLTDQERYKEYMRVKMGRADIVIGTRSAVFAPLDNLGIIIIDEEHETTYKSESAPRYHAIEVAKYRCVKAGCPLLLGSATPSVESYYNAIEGRYSLYTLDERYNDAALPRTIIADMKESLKSGEDLSIGKTLRDELTMNLALGEQSILFINRRGNSKMAMCVDCGYVPECENCSVSLTYHSANGRLMCHHCGYSVPLMDKCPECGGGHIKLVGIGTQKIENEIAELYPQARVMRMDADTTEGRKSHEEILDAFGNKEADILLGTQMVAKGLDFLDVTLVGVIDADQALQSGSYLAGERSFSLISQVVGRAGRREKLGRAVIQSFSPSNPVIRAAAAQDYRAFFDYEIDVRQLVKAPPFYDIFTFFLSGEDEERVKQAADAIAKGLKSAFDGKYKEISSPVLGPAPAAIAKVNNKYRYTVVFKGKETKTSRALVSDILAWFASLAVSKGISVAADINTFSF